MATNAYRLYLVKVMQNACFIYLKVVFDFVLKEARVFFQGLSELCNAVADSEQIYRISIVVPG